MSGSDTPNHSVSRINSTKENNSAATIGKFSALAQRTTQARAAQAAAQAQQQQQAPGAGSSFLTGAVPGMQLINWR